MQTLSACTDRKPNNRNDGEDRRDEVKPKRLLDVERNAVLWTILFLQVVPGVRVQMRWG